jgi:hypothetical protein
VKISIENADILQVPADLIVLKYADEFHGADKAVAAAIGFDSHVNPGDEIFLRTRGKIPARLVVFIGVGPLIEFRYERIQEFGRRAVEIAENRPDGVHELALTIHGPGYGLDPEQAFLSMIAGVVSASKLSDVHLEKVTIVERSEKRCELLQRILNGRSGEFGFEKTKHAATVTLSRANLTAEARHAAGANIIQFGSRAEENPRPFVAMPFASDFIDEFDIGFHEAAKANSFICERLDLHVFTGDIVTEMKARIVGSHGVIALLNGHNPNVFLEIGFALAYGKPIILVAKEGVDLPFDVRSHRCIKYKNISELRQVLTKEIALLKEKGLLTKAVKQAP